MYHITNLGMYDHPRPYADIQGYVPEPGDDWRDMRYDIGPDAPSKFASRIEEHEAELAELQEQLAGHTHTLEVETDEDERDWLEGKIQDIETEIAETQEAIESAREDMADAFAYLDKTWWPEKIAGAVKATRIAEACIARRNGAHFGELTAAAIARAGWTQRAVAEALGVSQPNVAQRLSRESVSVEFVAQIAEVIGWTLPEIIGD
jgi:hypothetical protein